MNHYILIAILLIICILVGYYVYKYDLENTKAVRDTQDSLNNVDNVLPIPSNIDSITTDKYGNIHIFKNDKYWKLINGEASISGANVNSVWNFPKNWEKVDLISWDKYNENFIIIKNNKVYPYKNGKINMEVPLNEYWNGLSREDGNFDHVLYFNDKILFIKKNKILQYDPVKNTKSYNSSLFENLDLENVDGIFLNKNDHLIDQPFGSVNIVKGDKYFTYNQVEQKLEMPGYFFNTGVVNKNYISYLFTTLGNHGVNPPKKTDSVKYTDKVVSIKNGKQSWIVPKNSNYRIICGGAGTPYGGKGGLVFNDLELKKGDKVDVLVGQSGSTMPIANTSSEKKLNKMGSSSGSGGTFVWINDKLSLVAGGAGGWSSEIHPAPKSCDSVKYDENAVPINGKIHIPIKKIIITCENLNTPCKIILNGINVDSKNNVLNIKETPQVSSNKEFLGETDYSKTPPNIEINFDSYLIDYDLNLDYDILSSNTEGNKSVVKDIVKVIDTEGDIYTIYDFNKKGMGLNSEILLSEKLGYIPKCVERNNQLINDKNAESGGNVDTATKKSVIEDKNLVSINGGFGGGGAATSNKENLNFSNCGGGGGFLGGNSGVSNITEDLNGNKYNFKTINSNKIEIDGPNGKVRVKIPFVSASGGTSWVSPSNIDKVLMNEGNYRSNWENSFNSGNGFVKVIVLKDLHKKLNTNNNEEYISKTYDVIKKNASEKPLDNVDLKLVDTIVSTNNTNQYVSGISMLDNNYNVKNIDFSVKSKEIETSSCNSMMDVNINKDIYDKKMINRGNNPITEKSFYKLSSLRGICDKKITVIKFPISRRVNLRNVKINIDLESDDKIDFSGMFNYIHIKENSLLRYMAYLNRPEEDIIPDDLLSFNVSRERCNLMKNKEELFEEMSKLNIAGFSNKILWENAKNNIAQNMKIYPKYLENEQDFNLIFNKTKHEDKIFNFSDHYKANIKTKWGNIEPEFLYILLNNNTNNSEVYYNVSFVEYDKNGVSTFDYLKLLEAPNIDAGRTALKELKKKREFLTYEVNKQVSEIMNEN